MTGPAVNKKLKYNVYVHRSHIRNISEWCESQFGPRWCVMNNQTGRWTMFWARINIDYYKMFFAKETDLIWFSLRWPCSSSL